MTQKQITMPGKTRTAGDKSQAPPASKPSSPRFRLPTNLPRKLRFEHWALVPMLVFLILLVAYPLLELIRMAFSTATPTGGDFEWSFSGLANFRAMLTDTIFHAAVRNVLIFVAATTAVQLVLGTALALLVERARWLSGLARNVLVWPAIVTPVAISATFWLMLNPDFGLLNHLLSAAGLSEQTWLTSTTWALPTLMVVDVWHWTPVVFLLVLAGLAGIDRSLYEAARMDGASGLRVFISVTLPLLAPTLIAAAMIRIILGFKVFDEVFLLTSGGPGTSTEVLSSHMQQVFFGQLDMGYGAFLGIVILAFLSLILAGYSLLRPRIER